MFELTIKGKNLDDLRKQAAMLNAELNQQVSVGPTQTKVEIEAKIKEAEERKIQNAEPAQKVPSIAPIAQVEHSQESPAPVSTSEVDSNGFAWDERIHSAKKSKSKDGTWRYRRNIDKDLIAKVEAELRGGLTSAAPLVDKMIEAVAPPPVEPPRPVQQPEVPTPQAPPQPVAPPIDASSVKQSPESFRRNLTGIITRLIGEGKINQDYISQLNQHFGVTQIWEVFEDDQKCEELYESFVEFGLIERA